MYGIHLGFPWGGRFLFTCTLQGRENRYKPYHALIIDIHLESLERIRPEEGMRAMPPLTCWGQIHRGQQVLLAAREEERGTQLRLTTSKRDAMPPNWQSQRVRKRHFL
jgi:hypothetical protein